MKRTGNRVNRKTMIALLAILLVTISIGYAYLNANIKISGSSKIKANKWDIHFENVSVTENSVAPISPATIDTDTKQTVSYNVKLEKPGDFYEFIVDVVNSGTIDAMLGDNTTLIGNDLTEAQKVYANYLVSYEDGTAIKKGDKLNAGATKKVKVRIEFRDDITADQLPNEAQEGINLTFGMNYVQADEKEEDTSSKSIAGTISNSVKDADTSSTDEIGDTGLAYDGTADNNLRYVGATPNNYVKFNNELWRIVGVFNNIDNGTGKKETRVKIMRNESLGQYSWDTSESSVNSGYGVNEWSQADLQKELNTDYLGNVTIGTDGKWYNDSSNSKNASMPTTKLSSEAQSMIDNAVWNTGANDISEGDYYNISTPAKLYSWERSTNTGKQCTSADYCNDTVERTTSWTGKVALIYPSDYGFATSGSASVSRNKCLSEIIPNYYDGSANDWSGGYSAGSCATNDWIYNSNYWEWTLNPVAWSSDSGTVFSIGRGGLSSHYAYYYGEVRPAVFLKSSITISGGTGTSNDPYTLSAK